MSWKKIILVIIFCNDCAFSKEGSLKLQMKGGNFFFDDGSGEVPLDVVDKGPDISSLQGGGAQSVPTESNLDKTLKMFDKSISERGSDQDNNQQSSGIDETNNREKISELQRLLSETNLVDAAAHGEESDLRIANKGPSVESQSNAAAKLAKGVVKTSKVSDGDMQKIREVIDKEYGNSILLIPKNELEYFIHFVKEYSLNDLLRNSDSAEFQNAEDRMRLRDLPNPTGVPRYQLNWSKALTPKAQPFENVQLTPENRQLLVEEFSRFLDLLNAPRNFGRIQSYNISARKAFDEPINQMPSVQSNAQTGNVDQQELASFEAVKSILDNLSDDQSKQSLMRLFDKNAVAEPSHSNCRRSLGRFSFKSSPMKKKKDKQRGNAQNATDKASQYQRISRGEKHVPKKLFPAPLRSGENFESNGRHTRADIIR